MSTPKRTKTFEEKYERTLNTQGFNKIWNYFLDLIKTDKFQKDIEKFREEFKEGQSKDLRGITEEMYDSYLREYKEKQSEILSQMQDHSDADGQFYLTANMTLSIAQRAKEIFISSEPEEKRQFLGFLLQNCTLDEKKLEFSMRSPFNLIVNRPDDITLRRR